MGAPTASATPTARGCVRSRSRKRRHRVRHQPPKQLRIRMMWKDDARTAWFSMDASTWASTVRR